MSGSNNTNNAKRRVLLYATLADDKNDVVLEGIGKVNASQLQRAYPASHLFAAKSGEDFVELFDLAVEVFVAFASGKAVEFFVVVVLYLAADGGKQTVFLAHLMLTAAACFGFFDNLGEGFYLPAAQLLAEPPLPDESSDGGYNAEGEEKEEEGVHLVGGWEIIGLGGRRIIELGGREIIGPEGRKLGRLVK